jgi:hypothetical protein
MIEELHSCSICGGQYSGSGNDPEPVMNDGTCCDDCNFKYVIPARLKELREELRAAESIDRRAGT